MLEHALSVRSDHSIGESILQIPTLVASAKEQGFKTVALTDTMSISGLPSFSSECKKNEITPILGCTLRVFDDAKYRPPSAAEKRRGAVEKKNHSFMIKVYVKSETGLRSLMELLSKANSSEQFYYTARTDVRQVLGLKDVIVTTGDLYSIFHHPNYQKIVEVINKVHKTYIEIAPVETMLFDTLNKKAIACARSLGIPMVASYPRFYASSEQSTSHDVLRAIASSGSYKIGDSRLPVPVTRDWCFDEPKGVGARMVKTAKRIGMTSEEVKQSFVSMDEIVDACHYRFEKMPISLPEMATDGFRTLVEK